MVALSESSIRLKHSPDGVVWAPLDVELDVPAAPLNFRATNMGAAVNSIDLAWDAVPTATSYKVYGTWTGSTTPTVLATAPGTVATISQMGLDMNHSFYVESVNAQAVPSSSWAGPVNVRTGHYEQAIEAGNGYVASGMNSHNKWREGIWGYNGAEPYWGYYTEPAWRYHGFLEIAPETMWQVVTNSYPFLGPYRHLVASTGFGLFCTRKNGVGDWGFTVTAQIGLANGMAYANPAEPPYQGSVFDIGLQANAAGRVGYSLPGNWPAAIYQYHASYNGLHFHPYRTDGNRQSYSAIFADASWDLSISWGRIVTVGQAGTSPW